MGINEVISIKYGWNTYGSNIRLWLYKDKTN